MPATVEICESNGAGETITHNISNSNMGNADSANLDPVANPVIPGNRTYVKYQSLHVTAMGGAEEVETTFAALTKELLRGINSRRAES